MDKTIKAELVSVGTELLRGEIVDTNAAYIAGQLPLLGIQIHRLTTAGDDITELCQVVRQAFERSDIIITSGGLGPTQDDLTREAIAETLKEQVTVDPVLEKNLRAMFSRLGREMPPHNIKQAWLIPSASSLPNPRGTAPGWWVEKDDKVIVTLPGPPREMMPMWQNEVVSRIKKRFPGKTILARTIKTFLIQEARVAELAHSFFQSDNPTLGIYAKPDGIQIRFIATGDDATQLLDEAEKKLTELLTPYVWGRDDDTLDGLISRWLIKHGLTLATMEDVTGGLLGNIITSSVDSQKYYRGGLITASDETKITWGVPADLLVQYGASSTSAAESMSASVRQKLSTDFGLSVTGISTGQQPGMVYIGIADAYGSRTWQQQYQAGRADTKERAAVAALFRLRERLIELNLTD